MRTYRAQKTALTRAVNSGDGDKVRAECERVVCEWDTIGMWPDDWHRWQRALDDTCHWTQHIPLTTLHIDRRLRRRAQSLGQDCPYG